MDDRLLIVDDDVRMRELLMEIFNRKGYSAVSTGDSREALMMIRDEHFDVIMTDLKMPHIEGLEVLEYSGRKDPDVPVILITAYGTVESAIEAMKKGAYDYIQKPFEPEEIVLTVQRALAHHSLIKRNRELSEEIAVLKSDEIIGSSKEILNIKGMIDKAAPIDVTVILQGETGTGKELVARSIHKNSLRAENQFLPINCGAIAETLLESELFGHEKGAFTGAGDAKKGLFEVADGGTLFLDEINNMSQPLQMKLLRFLQDKCFIRVGGTGEVRADVRIIAATNRDLKEEVEQGRFRDDLYYRLNVFSIRLPRLSERKEDIPELSYHFLRKYATKYGKNILDISNEAMRMLMAHKWPGNVRELENAVERAVVVESEQTLNAISLPDDMKGGGTDPLDCIGLMRLDELEQFLIRRALRETGNNKTQAAKILGIDASTLWRKMKKAGIG
jgi:DNA-binding NtrC family response regulator